MLVFSLLAAGLGIALTVLSFFVRTGTGLPRSARPEGSTARGSPAEGSTASRAAPPSPAELRWWGLPLAATGLLGTTLSGLGRPVETTLLISLGAGLPVGLLAAWLLQRLGVSRP